MRVAQGHGRQIQRQRLKCRRPVKHILWLLPFASDAPRRRYLSISQELDWAELAALPPGRDEIVES
ncbi:hypothetical protein ELH75_19390 [Rhizobium leguminosarum]|nr:hypothetical protein ELI37_19340 [Rhizobium leguminosarum]TAZ63260.1 hypothetical protein ELH75_19390 [Rhizobium leguminosarum]